MTSWPLDKRTQSTLRRAELGFLGVFVVTFVQTPRLNGEGKNFGRFFKVLKVRIKATDLDFRFGIERLLFIS